MTHALGRLPCSCMRLGPHKSVLPAYRVKVPPPARPAGGPRTWWPFPEPRCGSRASAPKGWPRSRKPPGCTRRHTVKPASRSGRGGLVARTPHRSGAGGGFCPGMSRDTRNQDNPGTRPDFPLLSPSPCAACRQRETQPSGGWRGGTGRTRFRCCGTARRFRTRPGPRSW